MFRVALRIDDIEILEQIRDTIGFGNITEYCTKTTWVGVYAVTAIAECLAIVQLFRRFPLQSKKRIDFEIWAEIVKMHFAMDRVSYTDAKHLINKLRVCRKELLRRMERLTGGRPLLPIRAKNKAA